MPSIAGTRGTGTKERKKAPVVRQRTSRRQTPEIQVPPRGIVALMLLAMPGQTRAARALQPAAAQRAAHDDSIGLELDRADPYPGQEQQARESGADAHEQRPPSSNRQAARTYGRNLCASPQQLRTERKTPSQQGKPPPNDLASPTIIHGAAKNRPHLRRELKSAQQ